MPGFVPFLVVSFVIAALLRVDFFFTILYFLAAAYVLSRLWAQWTSKGVRAQRRFTHHAFFGDQVTVDLKVHNTAWLPMLWLKVHESLPVRLTSLAGYRQVLTLGPRKERRFQYTLHCGRRGYYSVGPLSLETGDLLGVVRREQVQLASENIVVYPQIVPLQALDLPTRSPQVALPARSPLFEDPSRIMGVREYQRGDSPRRIHWTATASAGQLLVKQYQPAIARETLICLDLDREGYGRRQRDSATELAIVVAASLAHHIIVREGLPVGLITEAHDSLIGDRSQYFLPPRRERAHLMNLLEVLARVQIVSDAPLTGLLRRGRTNLSWGATLSVITGRESEVLFDNLVYLRRAGFAVSLILVQPGLATRELRQRADLIGIPIHRVWRVQDVEMWR